MKKRAADRNGSADTLCFWTPSIKEFRDMRFPRDPRRYP